MHHHTIIFKKKKQIFKIILKHPIKLKFIENNQNYVYNVKFEYHSNQCTYVYTFKRVKLTIERPVSRGWKHFPG